MLTGVEIKVLCQGLRPVLMKNFKSFCENKTNGPLHTQNVLNTHNLTDHFCRFTDLLSVASFKRIILQVAETISGSFE